MPILVQNALAPPDGSGTSSTIHTCFIFLFFIVFLHARESVLRGLQRARGEARRFGAHRGLGESQLENASSACAFVP